MREIVLDTETTGLDPINGDRLVEIGCVEVVNHIATGETYHQYVNPQREMPAGAFDVHGLSKEFLSGYPLFRDIVDDFLDFIGNDPLVIHNAIFDMGFINAELRRLKRRELPMSQSVDTVRMARRKFPGAPASLDALCRRFDIDNSSRTYHGALLDAELLAEVYLELRGGRQPGLKLAAVEVGVGIKASDAENNRSVSIKEIRPLRPHAPSAEELLAHEAFVSSLEQPMWLGDPKK